MHFSRTLLSRLVCSNLDVFAQQSFEYGEVSDEFIHETLTAAGVNMDEFEIRDADGTKLADNAIIQRRV